MKMDSALLDRIQQYLDEVSSQMADVPQAERDETIHCLREQIEENLRQLGNECASPDDLDRIIVGMASPGSFSSGPMPAPTITRAKRSYRGTSLILVGLLAAVALFIHTRQRPAKTEAAVTVPAPSADNLNARGLAHAPAKRGPKHLAAPYANGICISAKSFRSSPRALLQIGEALGENWDFATHPILDRRQAGSLLKLLNKHGDARLTAQGAVVTPNGMQTTLRSKDDKTGAMLDGSIDAAQGSEFTLSALPEFEPATGRVRLRLKLRYADHRAIGTTRDGRSRDEALVVSTTLILERGKTAVFHATRPSFDPEPVAGLVPKGAVAESASQSELLLLLSVDAPPPEKRRTTRPALRQVNTTYTVLSCGAKSQEILRAAGCLTQPASAVTLGCEDFRALTRDLQMSGDGGIATSLSLLSCNGTESAIHWTNSLSNARQPARARPRTVSSQFTVLTEIHPTQELAHLIVQASHTLMSGGADGERVSPWRTSTAQDLTLNSGQTLIFPVQTKGGAGQHNRQHMMAISAVVMPKLAAKVGGVGTAPLSM